MIELDKLNTEAQNPNSSEIDKLSISEITAYINQEDQKVAVSVEKALPQINQVIELALNRLNQGGRIIYVGAGTSGRLGILDASECPPTFGVSPNLVQGIIAGGDPAIKAAFEGVEDDQEAAVADLQSVKISSKDMVIGIAASGRTPYVKAALTYAKSCGASTGSISCVKDAELSGLVNQAIEVLVGPEVVAGSSRMKAGTAQKMILNMISTTCMIRLGKVFRGYMVDVQPTNEKLIERAKRIIQETTGASSKEAETIFEAANYDVKLAILMQLSRLDLREAKEVLSDYGYNISLAIQSLLEREK